ncbi:MAG: Hpt domain-containing protein [Thiomicrospira sp.]|jgi:HPt (histidine-containing phosphotransfer) domain-containing protein|nr:Hpt domain-containing protein [Thiomicrospira sp.]
MSQVIDYDNLNMLKSVIGDDLKPILTSFLDITPALIKQVEQAIQQQDASALQHHAHTLKGSAANIGALALPAVSLKLEIMGKNGQLDGAEALFTEVEQAYQTLAQAIQAYIAEF